MSRRGLSVIRAILRVDEEGGGRERGLESVSGRF